MIFKNSSLKLKLFPSSMLIKGFSRSLLLDTGRNKYQLIPNTLASIIEKHEGKTYKSIYKSYPENTEILDEYFTLLDEHEHLILLDDISLFPKINLEKTTHQIISNSIIDGDNFSIEEWTKIFNQLLKLHCTNIQLRFFREKKIEFLDRILSLTLESKIRCIDIVLPYSLEYEQSILSFIDKHQRIRYLLLHSSPKSEQISSGSNGSQSVVLSKDRIKNESHCGFIFPEMFIMEMELYTESKHYNSCLNRKVSIDDKGDIKNCPSMSISYGNIRNTTLSEVVDNPKFREYWNIKKDDIKVCKDCEFRHICTDCRAYLENPEDMYSKPLKCGYDPYSCKWEDWSQNPLKQSNLGYYEEKNFPKEVEI
ncbi:MAG: grasp-with-spasm system SPASM domain peptide maturase [Bacteroidota bacterium]